MKINLTRAFPILGAIVVSFFHATSAMAEEGELWRIEVNMEMPGAPPMPAQSVTQCLPKKSDAELSEAMIPAGTSCKTHSLKNNGNAVSFSLSCNGQGGEMSGTGEFERQGSDRYRGKIQMVMGSNKGKMEMRQTFNGQRIGSCDYQKR